MTKCPAGMLSLSKSETFNTLNYNNHSSELGPNSSVLAGVQNLHPVLPWLPMAHGTGLLIRFTPLWRHNCLRVWNSTVLNSQLSSLCLQSPNINFTHWTLHGQPNTSYSSNIKQHKLNITNYTLYIIHCIQYIFLSMVVRREQIIHYIKHHTSNIADLQISKSPIGPTKNLERLYNRVVVRCLL